MTTIEILQIVGACLALFLQIAATILTKNVRQLFPQKLWWVIFGLNFLELVRRAVILFSITHVLNHLSYDLITVVVGFIVSLMLFVVMLSLSQPTHKVKKEITELAKETAVKAAQASVEPKKTIHEDSVAFGLAQHFINSREQVTQQ